jgi:hypothetical protein
MKHKIIFAIEKLIAAVFILAGISALLGGERFVSEFSRWGYSMNVLALFASLEVIFGGLLLAGKRKKLALAGLFLTLAWGLVHHVLYGDTLSIMLPGIVLIILVTSVLLAKHKKTCTQ